jgi:hypothetical protein
VDARLFTTLKGDKIVAEFIKILDDYVESHYVAWERKWPTRLGGYDVGRLFQPTHWLANRERRGVA